MDDSSTSSSSSSSSSSEAQAQAQAQARIIEAETQAQARISCFDGLPVELLQLIFSCLPFPSVFQARLVSKSWNSALTSPNFYRLSSPSPPNPSPWLLLHHPSVSLSASHPLSITAFHPFSNRRLNLPLDYVALPTPALVASSNGLLCFLHGGISSPTALTVCNPLTKSCQRLPYLLIHHPSLVGMATNRERNSYKIIACGSSMCLHAVLYDSTLGTWVLLPQPPLHLHSGVRPPPQHFVWWNGVFCVLSSDDRIITYHINTSQWGTLDLPDDMGIWNPHYLCLHVIQGRLLLEGNFKRVGNFQTRYPLVVGILELDQATLKWVEVGFMPSKYAQKLCPDANPVHSNYTAYADEDGDSLCFIGFPKEEEGEIVFYHLEKMSWSSMSACYRGNICSGRPAFKGLTFQPSFVAEV